jgi:hypothetical protein
VEKLLTWVFAAKKIASTNKSMMAILNLQSGGKRRENNILKQDFAKHN